MEPLNIPSIFKSYIAATRQDGSFGELSKALHEMDQDHNGSIGFKEMLSSDYIGQYCKAAVKNEVGGYRCDILGEMARHEKLEPSNVLAFHNALEWEIVHGLQDYANYRRTHGKVPEALVNMAAWQLRDANTVMTKNKLPPLDPNLLHDAIDFAETHLGQLQKTGQVPLAAPKGIPIVDRY